MRRIREKDKWEEEYGRTMGRRSGNNEWDEEARRANEKKKKKGRTMRRRSEKTEWEDEEGRTNEKKKSEKVKSKEKKWVLLNALNVEANSDFHLKFYFFGIFLYKSGQKTSPLNRFSGLMMWPSSVAGFLSTKSIQSTKLVHSHLAYHNFPKVKHAVSDTVFGYSISWPFSCCYSFCSGPQKPLHEW